jgi:hypothetical protein
VRLIPLEFNELSPTVRQKLMAGELPGFKRFHDESAVHETEADEIAPNLEPWIQWVTVHSESPTESTGSSASATATS